MNIVILAGGKGSLQLQKGIKEFFDSNVDECFFQDVNVEVLINAFDDGLSTGLVRKVYGGKILGPSDLRKNQALRHEQLFGETDLLKFLNTRLTASVDEIKDLVISEIDKLSNRAYKNVLYFGARAYFDNEKYKTIEYDDFSISNIIYAGLAGDECNMLSLVGHLMSQVLCIQDHVIIANDESLFLRAYTKSGILVEDEYNIDIWDNPSDPIDRIFLVDHNGVEKEPVLSDRAFNALKNADIIISSSGTQWTSIIPTYMFKGFKEAYSSSKASKYLVMNRCQDKDMTGSNANDILDIVSRYVPLKNTTIIVDSSSPDESMKVVNSTYNTIHSDIGGDADYKHDPLKLTSVIFKHYYSKYTSSKTYVFDYDDTIVARAGARKALSDENVSLLLELSKHKKVSIATGNCISRVCFKSDLIDVYADGGANLYIDGNYHSTIDPNLKFNDSEIESILKILEQHGLDRNVENRNNVMVSVSPFKKEREQIISLMSSLYRDYVIKASGRTTIDIIKKCNAINDKSTVAKYIDSDSIVYLGDECYNGNDKPFIDAALEMDKLDGYMNIKSIRETNMFLKTLLSIIKGD